MFKKEKEKRNLKQIKHEDNMNNSETLRNFWKRQFQANMVNGN